ncbi:MAG: hypothetical protein JWP87_6192, partial [Labilithrix sp.]|nr:hypothetical protein [Labilithrix sp.]
MRRGLSSAFVIIVGSVSVAIVTACSLATSFDGLSSGAVLPDGGAVDAADVVTVPDGGDGGDGGTSMPRSCRDVTGATDGIYRIDPDGSGALPSLEVFCNMTIAGGGWTLVARSAMQGAPSFGWNVKTGDLDDDAKPYSLGVDAAGIAFTSILVGVRGSGKELAGN